MSEGIGKTIRAHAGAAAAVAAALVLIVVVAAVAVTNDGNSSSGGEQTVAPDSVFTYEVSGQAAAGSSSYTVGGTMSFTVLGQSAKIYVIGTETALTLTSGGVTVTGTSSPFGTETFVLSKNYADFGDADQKQAVTLDGIQTLTGRTTVDSAGNTVTVYLGALHDTAVPYMITVAGNAVSLELVLSADQISWQSDYTASEGLEILIVLNITGTRADGTAIVGTLTQEQIAEYDGGHCYRMTEEYQSGKTPADGYPVKSVSISAQDDDTVSYLGYTYIGTGTVMAGNTPVVAEMWASGNYTYYTESNAGGWYVLRIAYPGLFTMDIAVPGCAIADS